MLVFVLNKNAQPLMPCAPRKARLLLRNGEAKVVNRTPFVIKLNFGSSGYTQPVGLSLDTGAKNAGFAATANGKVLYTSEVKLRTDIPEKMKQRLSFRRTRRGRNTRYRASRFDNRSRLEGWLSPTMTSKVNSHVREINFIKKIMPVKSMVAEIAQFDIHKITNPEVVNDLTGKSYQTGRQKDFYNTKAFILSRDNYECKKCCGKKNNPKLHVHHIIFCSNGGTNSPDNLITLCEPCHNGIHAHKTPEKESLKFSTEIKKQRHTASAVQVSTVSSYLQKIYPEMKLTYGYETKFKREIFGAKKEHYNDAIFAGLVEGEICEMPKSYFKKVHIANGDYKLRNGNHSEQVIPTGKIMGFKKFDKIEYLGEKYFIKGRMSTGYAILMNEKHETVKLKPIPKFSKMKRISARKSCLTSQIVIGNSLSNITLSSSANTEKISLQEKKLVNL